MHGTYKYGYLKKLLKENKDIIPYSINNWEEKECITCKESNIQRQAMPKLRTTPLAQSFGDRIHMDIWGPASRQTPQGFKYILTLVDDSTRWCDIMFLKTKDNAYGAYMQYARLLKTQYNLTIKILQSDNDTVFLSESFNKFLAEEGTKRYLTVHDTPQQNGVVERMHGTFVTT